VATPTTGLPARWTRLFPEIGITILTLQQDNRPECLHRYIGEGLPKTSLSSVIRHWRDVNYESASRTILQLPFMINFTFRGLSTVIDFYLGA